MVYFLSSQLPGVNLALAARTVRDRCQLDYTSVLDVNMIRSEYGVCPLMFAVFATWSIGEH